MASLHQKNHPPTPPLQPPLDLILQTGQHVRRQRTINILSFFVPVGVATAIVVYIVLIVFSLPLLFLLIPLGLWAAFFVMAIRRTPSSGQWEAAATLIDEKTLSKERFLTLATLPESQHQLSLLPLLQRDTTQRAASFIPERDLPFHLDRRVPIGAVVSVLCVGAAFMLVLLPAPTLSRLVSVPFAPAPDQQDTPQRRLAELEKIAKKLVVEGKTPAERAAGTELVALAKKLKSPTLSPKEKEQLIEDAEERITLNLPLPQLLPFDLKMFASENQNDEGDGNQSDQPQPNDTVLAKNTDPSAQNKQNPSSNAPNQPQQGQQHGNTQDGQPKDQNNRQEDDTQSQPKLQEAGGGLKFEQAEQQGEKKQQPSPQQSGEQQQSASQHDPNQKTQGSDPNQPGDQDSPSPDPNKPGPTPHTQNADQQNADQPGQGKGIGKGKPERFSKPGEKPGGFLTKDTRFVKVRVPAGYEQQGESSKRTTENYSQAQPKTPYSNAPLKKGPANTSEPSQPIPLEYRDILK